MLIRTPGPCRRKSKAWTICTFALAVAWASACAQGGEVSVDLASPAAGVPHEAANATSTFMNGPERVMNCVSANGRYVVFYSRANNLVPNDNNLATDVFRYDRLTDTVELVSVNAAGTGSANGYSFNPTISADGMRVAFESEASDLDLRDSNFDIDVFVRDFTTGTTQLVSVDASGTQTGNSWSYLARICANGNRVAFVSTATNLHGLVALGTYNVLVRDLDTQTTLLASINAAGTTDANGACLDPVISADGSRVAFESNATNLHPLDSNSTRDIMVRDLDAGTTYLASVNSAGTAGGSGTSSDPVLSADGSRVAFQSAATNLHPLDANMQLDVYVRDLNTATTYLASVNIAGTAGGNNASINPTLSADGTKVAFESRASNLNLMDTDSSADIFVRDVDTGVIQLVSIDTAGTGSANAACSGPAISADGTHIAFYGTATNLHAADTDANTDVFVRDLTAGLTRLASTNPAGTSGGNGASYVAMLNADGTVATFQSRATNQTSRADAAGFYDIVVYDEDTQTVALASVANPQAPPAATALGDCSTELYQLGWKGPFSPISANGRYVVYETQAGNLIANDTNNEFDIFRYDRKTGEVVLVSVNAAGTGPGNGRSQLATISADGNRVAFQSNASDLNPLDTDNGMDVFVRDIEAGTTYLASVNAAGTANGNQDSSFPYISADGSRVAFESFANDLHPLDTNYTLDVFVRDIDADATYLASVNTAGAAGGNNQSLTPVLNANGSRVTFVSYATDLHALATVSGRNQFVRDLDTNTTYLVNVNRFGTGPSAMPTFPIMPILSADGKRAAFTTTATDVHPLDTALNWDVFVRDLDAGVTYLASVNTAGTGSGNYDSNYPSLSADGKRVAFSGNSSNLHPLAPGGQAYNVFVRDLDSGTTYLASIDSQGNSSLVASVKPSMSADGNRVAYQSAVDDLLLHDTNGSTDVYLRDLASAKTWLLSGYSTIEGYGSGNGYSATVAISADGSGVAFLSNSTDLIPGTEDTDYDLDVFLAHLGTADLKVTATESVDPVTAGSGAGNLSYTVTIENVGTVDATDITVALYHPAVQGVSITGTAPGGGSSFADDAWTVGDLVVGASETLVVTLTVDATAPGGTNKILFVPYLAENYEDDLNSSNNYQVLQTSIIRPADIAVSVSESADPVTAGAGAGNLSYTVTVSNLGPLDAEGLTLDVSTTLPTGVTIASSSASGSTSFDGSTWTVGALASGDSETLDLIVTVAANAAAGTDVISTQAEVATVNETDGAAGNDSDSEATSIARDVDLAMTIAESADPVTAGSSVENLTYTATVANNGSSDASGVTLDVSTTLPIGVTVASTEASDSTSFDGSTWTVGALASGGSETLTIKLTVAANAAAGTGVISAQASVATVTETDSDAGNDSDSEATSITRQSDLVVTKVDDGVLAAPDKVSVYTITVENQGPSDAANVVITETVPAGTVYSAAESEAGWNVSGTGVAGDTCTLDAGSLAAGTSTEVSFAVLVADPLSGVSDQIENTTSAASDSTEANEGDESDTVETFLVPNPIDDIDGDGIPNIDDKDDDSDGLKDEKDPDRDGDGVDDVLDPAPDDPTVLGPAGMPGTAGMTWQKVRGTIKFLDVDKDSFKASGVLLLPAAFALDGAAVDVDIGGEPRSFTLNQRGVGVTGDDKVAVRLKPTKPASAQVHAKVTLSLRKANLAIDDVDGTPFDDTTPGVALRGLRLLATFDDGALAPQPRYNLKQIEYKATDKKGSLKSLKP